MQRGFKPPKLPFSINGGVWTCKPKVVSEYLKDAYHAKKPSLYNNEPCSDELFFALETQNRNHFSELDCRFNYQILYDIYGDNENFKNIGKSWRFRLTKKMELKFPLFNIEYINHYKQAITQALNDNWFIHFAGKLPFLRYEK